MDASAAMDRMFDVFQGDSPALQLIGRWGYKIYDERDLVQMYIHLLLSALFPIYIGSHASLRRPPSAASPKKTTSEGEDDDEIEVEPIIEGLTPSDAIIFPVLAGITLAALYLIIKWLEDPALLNKILGAYFSGIGVLGVGKLAADGLNLATTFIFPSVWSSRGGETYYVEPLLSQQVTGVVKPARTQIHRKFVDGKTNPIPGVLSDVRFPKPLTQALWSLRALLKNHWIFRGYLYGIFQVKSKVFFNDVIGFVIGIAAIAAYNLTGKAWWLTNIIGFGFCYGTLQLMSPTTFWTGSLVLAGLFIYDVTMVFYTPLMVTVATSLDVPIKLVFPGPKRGGMLGLGDVVLPGIMMALALRFDLYLHYLHKQIHSALPSTPAPTPEGNEGSVMKVPYKEATTVWGERFWTRHATSTEEPNVAEGARFPKVYFKASLGGYVAGMLATLIVLNVYNHAQPALLYLVPGVLIALWGTALVRGELMLMWNYTEDGSLEDSDKNGDDKEKFKDDSKDGKTEDAGPTGTGAAAGAGLENGKADTEEKKDKQWEDHAHHVFLFSLSSPRQGPKKAQLFKKA